MNTRRARDIKREKTFEMITNFDFVKKKVASGSLFYITCPILLFMKNGPAF